MVGVSALHVLFYIKCQSDFKVTAVFEMTLRELNIEYGLQTLHDDQ